MPSKNAIRVQGVYKNFVLPHHKNDSIKSIFTTMLQRKEKGYEVQRALHDVSFEVKKGEFFGIVGRNGSGKSTLLKILAGIYRPTKGSVAVEGKLVPFIELGVGFNPELTGRENVFLNGAMLGFTRSQIQAMYEDIVSFAELERFMDQKLKNYSSGMQVRLAFSMATRSEADVLLVDEVLAVGDAAFQRKCFNYFRDLKKSGTTVVFVTHDMSAVREFCDRAMLIEKNEITAIGKPEDISESYAKLFLENGQGDSPAKRGKERWGSGDALIMEPRVVVSGSDVIVNYRVDFHKEVDSPIFGYSVQDGTGDPLFGTNSKLIRQKSEVYQKGDSVEVEWILPNIFNDGSFFITLAIAAGDGTEYDWFQDAVSFDIMKTDKTPYAINPPSALRIKKI